MPAAASFLRQPLGADLRPRKDQHRTVGPPQVLDQPLELAGCRQQLRAVRNRLGRLAALADLHVFRLAHDLQREPHHVVRHRRRKEQRLRPRRHRRDDAPHVGPEAHVHHAVGFVEHQHLDGAEVGVLLPHVIDQPSRGGDDDVDARSERALLAAHLDAAVDRGAGDGRVVRRGRGSRLRSARPARASARGSARGCAWRRRSREGAGSLVNRGLRSAVSAADCASALSSSWSIGTTNAQVLPVPVSAHAMTSLPLERQRNDRALDRPGFLEAEVAHPFEQALIEVERCERNRRRVAECRFERRSQRCRPGDVRAASAPRPASGGRRRRRGRPGPSVGVSAAAVVSELKLYLASVHGT